MDLKVPIAIGITKDFLNNHRNSLKYNKIQILTMLRGGLSE